MSWADSFWGGSSVAGVPGNTDFGGLGQYSGDVFPGLPWRASPWPTNPHLYDPSETAKNPAARQFNLDQRRMDDLKDRLSLTGPAKQSPPSQFSDTGRAQGVENRYHLDDTTPATSDGQGDAGGGGSGWGKREFNAFGQMIVGLAQAGAQAYAASKQKDLRDRMFQIVYSSGGGGGIHIPDPLADGIPRVG